MYLFYQPEILEKNYLDQQESRHCIKVLRHKQGDIIKIADGKGSRYTAEILIPDDKQCTFKILTTENLEKPKYHIHIALAPTKNLDRIEWFVEKATEIGIHEISFLKCQYSERKDIKLERIVRKVQSAFKQSQRSFIPKINTIQKINQFLLLPRPGEKYIAHVNQEPTPHLKNILHPDQNYTILIGPEGDFSLDELKFAKANGFEEVTLGSNRLRTETAAIVACFLCQLVNEK